MRLGLDVTSAVKPDPTGIAVYVRGLLQALPAVAPETEPVLFVRDGRWFKRRFVADLLPDAPRRWLLTGAAWELRGLDAFHSLGVRLPRRCAARRSFTLHDLRGIEAQEFTDPRWVRLRSARIRETVARADRILFHTEHARERFHVHFPGFARAATGVAYPGIDHRHFAPVPPERHFEVRERHGLDRPFLLQVGAPVPHKNPDGSLRAFALSQAGAGGMLFAFAGGADPETQADLSELAAGLGVGGQVRWLGRVPYAELPVLYSAAQAVLMPSHYEGFGFPVLEAMACGAAGVVSTGTSLPEIAGGCWPAADPRDPEAIARALDRLLIQAPELEGARRAARERAAEFTWDRCARHTAEFLAGGRAPF